MAKEKRLLEKQNEKIYYYEITGTVVILFVLITFSELGYVGVGLKSLLKILFGDYYFVILFYLLFCGIKALVKKTWFDFTSIKLNGFLIFFFSLITLNHLGFYQRLDFEDKEIFTQSLSTYMNVLKNLIHINSYGGGVIGALFTQLLIFLFNSLGTMIILIVLMILSLSFMTSISYKTILYYVSIILKKVRSVILISYKYFNNIKFPTKTIKRSKLNLNINMLNDIDNLANEAIAQKIAIEDKNQIIYYLTQRGVSIIDVKTDIGYQITRYTILCNNLSFDKDKIKQITNTNIIIYEESNKLIIETSNKVKRLLTIKKVLLNTNEIPLGIEVDNQIITFNPIEHKNLLLTGSNNSGIKNFVKSFIISNIFKNKYDFKLNIIDLKQEFLELKYMPNLFNSYISNKHEVLNNLDLLAKELERRIDIINDSRSVNYIEYNKTNDKLEEIYVLINSLDELKSNNQLNEAKLLYFLKFGFKVGIHFIIINRNYSVDKEVLVNIQTKLIFKCSTSAQSYEVLNNNNGCFLESKADIILNNLDKILRINSPFISDSDYDKIISKFIVN